MKELIVQLSDKVALSGTEITQVIEGITNQQSGFMALKSVCQKENLRVNAVFDWVRAKGWLEDYPEVPVQAILDWCDVDKFTMNISIASEDILLMIINNSHYVNTNSRHYNPLITALTEAGLTAGYNREVKRAKGKLTDEQKIELRKMGYKVTTRIKL